MMPADTRIDWKPTAFQPRPQYNPQTKRLNGWSKNWMTLVSLLKWMRWRCKCCRTRGKITKSRAPLSKNKVRPTRPQPHKAI